MIAKPHKIYVHVDNMIHIFKKIFDTAHASKDGANVLAWTILKEVMVIEQRSLRKPNNQLTQSKMQLRMRHTFIIYPLYYNLGLHRPP